MQKKIEKTPWTTSAKNLRAIQIAFDLGGNIPDFIRAVAANNGLSPSDQIRKIVNLPYRKPKRPRLTLSLKESDYLHLAKRYSVPASAKEVIREKIREELETFYQQEIEKRQGSYDV
ncbi:MAG: hypothetical protein GXP08_15605 [Gammaproteobacteria bacterium]|nr:hypothetical protein [Gammaproteobacteria bacterium]